MNKIILLAESGADIPKEYAEKYNIRIVPMHVSFNNLTLDDGSFDPKNILDFHEKTKSIPKTSGSNIGDFEDMFDKIHAEEPDAQILYLAYSAITTCSYGCAKIAMQDRPYVYAMDTKMYSIGQGQIVVAVAKAMEEHPDWTVEQLLSYAEELSGRAHMSFAPDTLDFLKAGGRVTNGAAALATMLRVHPCIDAINGSLVAGRKYIGSMHRILPKMIEDFLKTNHIDTKEIWLCRTVGYDPKLVACAEKAAHACGCEVVHWSDCGGVISTHGGPNAFGIAGFSDYSA